MNIAKDKIFGLFVIVLMCITLLSCLCGVTLSSAIVDDESDPRFIVNFGTDYDITGLKLSYSSIAQDADYISQKLSSSAISNIESIAKKSFNSNYDLASLIYFTITDSNQERLQDFSVVNSIEIVVEYSGETTNTASDAFCAVFVSLESTLETQVLNGDYAVFGNVNSECKAVPIVSTAGSSGLVLTMDAPCDGFIFLLTMGKNENSVGTIIFVLGIIVCTVLVILILTVVRNYMRERRRKKFEKQIKEYGALESDEKLKDKVNKDISTKTIATTLDKKTNISPINAPKMPKSNKIVSSNQENAAKKMDINNKTLNEDSAILTEDGEILNADYDALKTDKSEDIS